MTARCDESAEQWREEALSAMEHLAPGSFTNLAPGGREAILGLSGIKASKPRARQGLSM